MHHAVAPRFAESSKKRDVSKFHRKRGMRRGIAQGGFENLSEVRELLKC
jgi:hypothetical protein